MVKSDLVIVYHRQPYEEVEIGGKTVFRENKSPNGIVPTLKSFFGARDHGAWVAWKEAADPENPGWDRTVEISDDHGNYTVSRLPLTPAQIESFYHVSSKEAFWPILHGFKERYNYDPVDWPTFREVNWAFAEAAAAEAAEGATVWVHDYNLWLVPGYLRKMRPDLHISFFHHTPFPGPDIFNVLPWRREIVDSLLACDCVGFQIPRYAANFVAVANSLFDLDEVTFRTAPEALLSEGSALAERRNPVSLKFRDRKIAIAVEPVGVSTGYIEEKSTSKKAGETCANILDRLGDSRLILSVGRTDYTKGGVSQLESFERILEANPELRGKIRLMHVSVPANKNMTVYQEIQAEIEATVGRINGRFGTLSWQPISLISRPIPFEDLVSFYRAADVAWITPLADGMNLVCKEYIAARTDGDGVLVLSEFAGAAVQLDAAVMTNPFSHRSMDSALLTALEMPAEDRKGRMKLLRAAVRADDIAGWGREQLPKIKLKAA